MQIKYAENDEYKNIPKSLENVTFITLSDPLVVIVTSETKLGDKVGKSFNADLIWAAVESDADKITLILIKFSKL